MRFVYNPSVGLLILRVALALVFVAHGAQKLFGAFGGGGISGTAAFFGSLGIPLPAVAAVVSGIVEFFGGILIAVGLLTRIAALLIAVDMLVALLVFHLPHGFFVTPQSNGIEFVMMNMAAALALVFAGAGRFAIDAGLERELERP